MNGKQILKKTLPIVLGIILIGIITLVGALIVKDKIVPGFSKENKEYAQESYITYKMSDGTEVKFSRQEVYNSLRGTSSENSTITDTVLTELLRIVDADLLAEYVNKVDANDVYELVQKGIFSKTFDAYMKDNKDALKNAAKKEGKSFKNYVSENLDETIEEFCKTLEYSYSINAKPADFVYVDNGEFIFAQEGGTDKLDEDGEKIYVLKVDNNSEVYKYYALEAAKNLYAKEQIVKEYNEDLAAYNEYQAQLEAYNKYLSDVEDYEDELEDWKNAGKKGTKPTKPAKVEAPEEEVEAPVLVESDFQSAYEEENYRKYWALIVKYSSQDEAENALLQLGIVIAENADGDNRWFHYGKTDYSSDPAVKALVGAHDYTTKGSTSIIIDDDYYNLLTTDEETYNNDQSRSAGNKKGIVLGTDAATGAYELSQNEVIAALISLYNQSKVYAADKVLGAEEYSFADDAYTFVTNNEDNKLYYTETELTSMGLYTSGSTSNKFYKFDSEKTFADGDTFSTAVVSANSNYYLYYICGIDKTNVTWEDYTENKEYYETKFYEDNLNDLLMDEVTATYTKNAVSDLRYESGLKFYDEVLEAHYMNNYTSDYEKCKKSNKYNVLSYELNGEKKFVSVDTLFAKLADKFAAYATVDLIQYNWVFLEAKDAEGNLFNKYVDYKAYLNGKKLSKCILDTDEAKKLWKNLDNYVENIKYYFSAGYYESQGYAASYGWNNFLQDYYFTNYNVKVTSTNELKLFLIYQQVISEYSTYLSTTTKENWESVYYTNVAKTLAESLNTTGVHLLISVPDVEKNEESGSTSNFVDPCNWTAEQIAFAENFYDEILNFIKTIDEDEIATVLSEIADAYANCPVGVKVGTSMTYPNETYTTKTIDGNTTYTHNYFDYDYKYYPEGSNVATFEIKAEAFSDMKALGFDLTCENLTVTAGAMVEEFEYAVRQIWNTLLPKLTNGKENNQTVIYDHVYAAQEYKTYDEEAGTESLVNYNADKSYLTTTYGMHVYVNQTATLGDYFTTNENGDSTLIAIPDYKYVQLYLYDLTKSSDEKYTSLSTLYSTYEEAKEDNDEFRINQVKDQMNDAIELLAELDLNVSFDEFYTLLEEYCGDDSAIISTQISTWFTSYQSSDSSSSGSYTGVFSDYASSSYYHLQYMLSFVNNFNNVTVNANEGTKDALKNYAEYFVENYYSNFSYISYLGKDKDGTEALLDAIVNLENYNVFTENGAKLFPAEDTTSNAKLTEAFNALKKAAAEAYGRLNAEDKEELKELAQKANVIPQ